MKEYQKVKAKIFLNRGCKCAQNKSRQSISTFICFFRGFWALETHIKIISSEYRPLSNRGRIFWAKKYFFYY